MDLSAEPTAWSPGKVSDITKVLANNLLKKDIAILEAGK
jgi:hypothetical protein